MTRLPLHILKRVAKINENTIKGLINQDLTTLKKAKSTVTKLENEIEDFQLEIFNSLGMQVKIIPDISSKQIDFNRENLPDGFYICLLVGNNNRIFGTAKIIIN